MPFTPHGQFNASSFSIFQRSLMQTDAVPLADIVDDPLFEQVFEKHGVDFADDEDAVYTPAITLWALISQVFFAKEQRSCKAAVLRVASLWATLGRYVCNTSTGAYCRARLKIPFEAVRDLVRQIALAADNGVSHHDIHEDNWLLCAVIGVTEELRNVGQQTCCSQRVGHREGRVEPRRNKRRPKVLALMTKPRRQYQEELKAAA